MEMFDPEGNQGSDLRHVDVWMSNTPNQSQYVTKSHQQHHHEVSSIPVEFFRDV